MSCVVKLKPFDPNRFFHVPNYASKYSAGKDIKASIAEPVEIKSQQTILIPTNLQVEIPPYYIRKVPKIQGVFGEKTIYEDVNTGFELELQVRPKSGYSTKKQLIVTNSPGTIDSDYRGEIKVSLTNIGHNTQWVQPEESIAQIVLAPIVRFDWDFCSNFTETERNEKGFGEMTQAVETKQEVHILSIPTWLAAAQSNYCLKCGTMNTHTKEVKNDVQVYTCSICQLRSVFSTEESSYFIPNKKVFQSVGFKPCYPDGPILNLLSSFVPTEEKFNHLVNPHMVETPEEFGK